MMREESVIYQGDNTSDVNLMAALAAMGVSATTVSVSRGGRVHRVWELTSRSADGQFNTSELLEWWRDETFEHREFGHPFARLKAAMRIRRDLVDGIKKDRPLEFVTHGDKIAIISPTCSEETERQIVGRLQ